MFVSLQVMGAAGGLDRQLEPRLRYAYSVETIAGRYEVEAELGSGGAAVVYLTQDLSLDVVRAVKVVSLEVPASDNLRIRLREEAKAMANLEHKHICRIYDVGADGDQDYIVMEYVESGSLQDRLDRSGPIEVEEAVAKTLQVLSALEAAHAAGIVHRDVKPQNILVDAAGDIRLCDFGIALVTGEDDRMTKTGVAMGSLNYMPPEQRADARFVEATADQYAAAATLYKLITNKTPVDLYLAPKLSPRWDGVPTAVAEVIRVATAARATDRYPDVSALSRALCRALERGRESGEFEFSPPTDAFIGRPLKPKGAATLMAVTATALAVALSAVIVLELQNGIEPKATASTPIEQEDPLPVLSGRWQGSWNNVAGAQLQLKGSVDDLTGHMWIPLGDGGLLTKIAGAYDPKRRELVFRDIGDTTSPGIYSATVDGAGIMSGSFDNGKEHGRSDFALVRIAE